MSGCLKSYLISGTPNIIFHDRRTSVSKSFNLNPRIDRTNPSRSLFISLHLPKCKLTTRTEVRLRIRVTLLDSKSRNSQSFALSTSASRIQSNLRIYLPGTLSTVEDIFLSEIPRANGPPRNFVSGRSIKQRTLQDTYFRFTFVASAGRVKTRAYPETQVERMVGINCRT